MIAALGSREATPTHSESENNEREGFLPVFIVDINDQARVMSSLCPSTVWDGSWWRISNKYEMVEPKKNG